jgi:hypothetical protein
MPRRSCTDLIRNEPRIPPEIRQSSGDSLSVAGKGEDMGSPDLYQMANQLNRLADEYSNGRFIAPDSGGYNQGNLALAWNAVLQAILSET